MDKNNENNIPNVSGKMKIEKVKPDKEELKARKKVKKDKRNARTARFRTGKNIAIWFNGLIVGAIVFVLCLGLLPLGTFLGLIPGEPIVSENVSKKGLIQLFASADELTLEDFPVIVDALEGDNGSGVFGGTGMFTSYKEVEETVDATADNFTAKLYYYKTLDGKYKRAFTDNGFYVTGVNSSTKLYYANLSKVPVGEMPELLIASFDRVEASKIFDTFGINVQGVMGDIIADKTIGELMSLDSSDIKLSTFIENNSNNETLVKIIEASCSGEGEEKKDYADITVADFDNFSANNIYLADVLPNAEQSLKDLLASATGVEYSKIQVSNLSSIVVNDIKLSSVLKIDAANKTIYDILVEAITISDLQPKTDFPEMTDEQYLEYKKGQIKVKDLSSFNAGSIRLSNVLPNNTANSKLYNILQDVVPSKTADTITVADLSGFNADNIKLNTVLPAANNTNLYKILIEALTVQDAQPKTDFPEMTDEQYLEYKKGQIKVKDLSSFNAQSIKLNTVITEANGNKFIEKLLDRDDVTVGNIGTKINELKIADVYAHSCFEATTNDYGKYVKIVDSDTYILKNYYDANIDTLYNGVQIETTFYAVSASANIWLFMLYDTQNVDVGGVMQHHDEHGHAFEYIGSGLTIGEMDTDISGVAGKIENSTLRQLADANILDDPNSTHVDCSKTINELIDSYKIVWEKIDESGIIIPGLND